MVEEKKKAGPHNVVMEDRKRLTVTGVTEIDSFDEQTVVLFCDTGELAKDFISIESMWTQEN